MKTKIECCTPCFIFAHRIQCLLNIRKLELLKHLIFLKYAPKSHLLVTNSSFMTSLWVNHITTYLKCKGNVRFKKVISHNLTFISTKLKTYRQFIMKCNLLLHNGIKVNACFPVNEKRLQPVSIADATRSRWWQ